MGARQLFNSGFEARASVGKSFRTPTFEEMYIEMIFSGHNYIGNESLLPETSTSYEASVKKSTYFSNSGVLINNLIVSYMDVKDRIDMARVGLDATSNPIHQFINISKYNMWNVSSSNQFRTQNLNVNMGVALIGISQLIENGIYRTNDNYLYSLNFNSSVSYTVRKWNTTVSAYFKYTGKQQQWVEGQSNYVISEIEPYSLLDASIRRTFFTGRLETTIGARNLFDIKNINQTRMNEGGGHAPSSQLLLAYGTSYFVKLMYNLNF